MSDRLETRFPALFVALLLLAMQLQPAAAQPGDALPASGVLLSQVPGGGAAGGPFLLRLNITESKVGSFSILVQAKSEVSLLMAPATTLMSQMNVDGAMALTAPLSAKPGLYPEFLTTLQASLSYYAPGEPNKEIDQEVVRRGLLVSGIPEIGKEMRVDLDPRGTIVEVTGVPASFVPYFKISLLSYPEKPMKPGETWQTIQNLPIAYDVFGEPAWSKMIATFSFRNADSEKDLFIIDMNAILTPDSAPTGGPSGPVKVSGSIEGTVEGRLSDGFPRILKNTSQSTIDFGFSNTIRIEQLYEARFNLPAQPVLKKP